MPSGRVHSSSTVSLAVASFGLVFYYTHDPKIALAFSLGAASGVFLTPDLDIELQIASKIAISRTFGKVIGKLWYIFWWPYGKLLPHRSWISHFPVISTLIRLIYLFFLPIFIILSTNTTQFGEILDFLYNIRHAIYGLVAADTLHFIMDIISTEIKMFTRKFK
jgi:uncharacterized metal-binding protein